MKRESETNFLLLRLLGGKFFGVSPTLILFSPSSFPALPAYPFRFFPHPTPKHPSSKLNRPNQPSPIVNLRAFSIRHASFPPSQYGHASSPASQTRERRRNDAEDGSGEVVKDSSRAPDASRRPPRLRGHSRRTAKRSHKRRFPPPLQGDFAFSPLVCMLQYAFPFY